MKNFLESLSTVQWAIVVTIASFLPLLGILYLLQSLPWWIACLGYLTLPVSLSYLICRIFLWIEFGRWK